MGSPERGRELLSKAEGKLKSFWPFTSPKWDEAAELFQSAAAQFMASRMWSEAGAAHMRAADCFIKKNEKHSYCQSMAEAANCFKRVPGEEARKERAFAIDQAISGFIDAGRFFNAARLCKQLAEEEAEFTSTDDAAAAAATSRALEYYGRAFDYYTSENRTSESNDCQLKSARLRAGRLHQYGEAAGIFERVGNAVLDTPIGKFAAKDHFFSAAICRLAAAKGDDRDEALSAARDAVDRYTTLDPMFAGSREEKLCRALVDAFEEGDPEAVSAAAAEYDNVKRLDPWTAGVLCTVKEAVMPDVT
eukprot:TRINITY_DN45783_c0_g1_i1.p2 TRINITY_DN45783_c0_g1~~TRINITY_DN45783_c0_g1_i1.p2  ORF type:complete len:305 (-),score=67.04 TRINITY_DN45783_c0_g1_i1:350-1264(-)